MGNLGMDNNKKPSKENKDLCMRLDRGTDNKNRNFQKRRRRKLGVEKEEGLCGRQ